MKLMQNMRRHNKQSTFDNTAYGFAVSSQRVDRLGCYHMLVDAEQQSHQLIQISSWKWSSAQPTVRKANHYKWKELLVYPDSSIHVLISKENHISRIYHKKQQEDIDVFLNVYTNNIVKLIPNTFSIFVLPVPSLQCLEGSFTGSPTLQIYTGTVYQQHN